MKKSSVAIYFDKRRIKEGFYSVKWAVYFNSSQKLISTGEIISEKETAFLKANRSGLSGRVKDEELRNLWNKVYGENYTDPLTGEIKEGLLHRAQKTLAKIEQYFTFEIFAKVISGELNVAGPPVTYSTDLLQALRDRAKRFEAEGQISSSRISLTAAISFERFSIFKKISDAKYTKLPMQIVSKNLLKEYEEWMKKYGKASHKKDGRASPATITTISINLRNARTVFNEAIEAKVISPDIYPFGKSGFVIPAASNKKKALDPETVSLIFNFKCTSVSQARSRDLWVFSYLCNGINFADICNLRWADYNVKEEYIEFTREKTKQKTRKDIRKIRINLLPESIQIIEKWGNKDKKPESYLFPFLDISNDNVRKIELIKQLIQNTNRHMNKIGELLKIEVKLNTYEARHTFATTLLRSEAPLAFISQSLGHASIATTQNYLGSFGSDQTKKYLSALIPKKKEEELENTPPAKPAG